jgi:hypothetical protein
VTIARHTRWQVILQHIKQSDIVKFNSFSHTVMRLGKSKAKNHGNEFYRAKTPRT